MASGLLETELTGSSTGAEFIQIDNSEWAGWIIENSKIQPFPKHLPETLKEVSV